MATQTQVSAYISATTKERLERFVDAHGLKKAAVIESALLHHLLALEELPTDIVVPARIVVSPGSFEQIADSIESPPPPTEAMRDLYDDPDANGADR